MTKGKFRVELDSMGEVMVTRDSYYGAQTRCGKLSD